MLIRIKKGLDIPLDGPPDQVVTDATAVETVAVLGTDILGLRPGMEVTPGDRVKLGQCLFRDKRNPDVPVTSPGSGEVIAINRGARRALQSVVIRLEGNEEEVFAAYESRDIPGLAPEAVRENLVASGLWVAFRTRPYSRIPAVDSSPAAIFVTAMDTNPLAADPAVVIGQSEDDFVHGLAIIGRLTDGSVYVCTRPGTTIPCPETGRFRHARFSGPHPAGLAGTHIHFLEPASSRKTIWHVGYQDVIAIGSLFMSGRLPVQRIISLAGPGALRPRLIRTRAGASTADLLRNETTPGSLRIVSGSVLSGHRASGPLSWLGRYHNQVTVLREGSEREFLSWARPGINKFSLERAFAAHLKSGRKFDLTTTQNGSPRAMVSIGSFEKVVPLDLLPTPLLKALLVKDTDRAQELGCLELDEEDLALCSFVCNGKYEYGPHLRSNLDEIEAHG
ncbi:MAG: Na(+)-translocating NADH-quinone reductase subunit A [Gammaproteobacteria bacterium]|nr:Na(+)-translocating NADH-quinone reductase subunit A [Gammaproteobacteria bacterium]